MKLTRTSILSASSLLIGGFIGASALVALADSTWSGAPTCTTMPCNNAAAPINVGGGGDPLTYPQTKTGILGLNNLVVKNLQVLTSSGTTSVTQGQVLTAIDNNGTVGWRAGAATGGGGGVVFLSNPVVLATLSNTAVGWTNVGNLISRGVPATASGVILATEIHGNNAQSYTHIYMRPSSTVGTTTVLAEVQTSGGGAPALSNMNQGLYPVSASSGSVTFDYKADGQLDGSTITLVGYIGQAPSAFSIGTFSCSAVSGYNNSVTLVGSVTGGVLPYNYTFSTAGVGAYSFPNLASPGTYGQGLWHGFDMTGSYTTITSNNGQSLTVPCSAS